MTTSEEFVRMALTQKGDRYVWAAEASPLDPDPDAFDCSELVEWALARLHMPFPDGSQNQYNVSNHISVNSGISTRGALLFRGAPRRVHHVAISLGDGTTIEAKGHLWGVGVFSASGRGWDGAGKVPRLEYVPAGTKPPINQGGGIGIGPESNGAAVTFLQNMINIIRSKNGRSLITVDGKYGDQTKAAIAEFQKEWESIAPFHRLINIDLAKNGGRGDPDTLRAIGIAVNLIMGN